MLTRPKFRDHFHVHRSGERYLLISETDHHALSGRLYDLIVPLIDGRRTSDEIASALEADASATDVYFALLEMEKKGYIAEASDLLPRGSAAFWSALSVDAREAARRLAERPLRVCGFGDVPLDGLVRVLQSAGVRVSDGAERWLAITDDYLRPELGELNRRALIERREWLLCQPNGLSLWLGPIFQPGSTGCWECLAQRLRSNRDVQDYARSATGSLEPFPALAALPASTAAGLDLAATAVALWIVTGRHERLEGRLVTLDLAGLRTQDHALVRRPQCPACGDPDLSRRAGPAPLVLRDRPKTFVADGGHRAVTPEETLRRYSHHVSPITGVVKQLYRTTDESDQLQHVYISGQNMAMKTASFLSLTYNLRSSSAGKGMTDAQARASAICEAIERYSGVFRGEEPRIRASFRSLGERAIDPRSSMLFSEAQYRNRDDWNARRSRFNLVPLTFDEEAELEWSPLWSLTRKEFRYLPASYCYYSYPEPPEQFFCAPDSNGAAAGNSVEEAILQGFMELVERDSVAIWWYNRLHRPAVDLESFDEPYFVALRDYHTSVGRHLWVLDLTADLGIPAFAAISRRTGGASEDICFAPAAHFDPRIGVLRALTELNQMIPGAVPAGGEGSEQYAYFDPEANEWWRSATLASQPYLAPAEGMPLKRQSDYARLWTDNLRDDVLLCQSIVEKQGLELLVLDQTRPDIGLPVVKVVVPGLRHFWARYAPGRLYDVPVKLGWLPAPLPEGELNPITVFI